MYFSSFLPLQHRSIDQPQQLKWLIIFPQCGVQLPVEGLWPPNDNSAPWRRQQEHEGGTQQKRSPEQWQRGRRGGRPGQQIQTPTFHRPDVRVTAGFSAEHVAHLFLQINDMQTLFIFKYISVFFCFRSCQDLVLVCVWGHLPQVLTSLFFFIPSMLQLYVCKNTGLSNTVTDKHTDSVRLQNQNSFSGKKKKNKMDTSWQYTKFIHSTFFQIWTRFSRI